MLYIVATPLGNLGDISDRMRSTLADASFIIAENPLHTKTLLDYVGISGKRMIQFAEHNEHAQLPKIIAELKMLVPTQSAVLTSDAGTPGISDPGFKLIRACIAEGITVSPIPGPNAAVSGLSASGLPTDKFLFFGFVPKTEIKLTNELKKAETAEATAVFYESPHRIVKTIGYIAKEWPAAQVVVAREMTKIHEEFIRGTATAVATNLAARLSIKGEMTVLVSFKS